MVLGKLIWIIVGQGPIALAVGASGVCLDIFTLVYLFSFEILSERSVKPKTTNQSTKSSRHQSIAATMFTLEFRTKMRVEVETVI